GEGEGEATETILYQLVGNEAEVPEPEPLEDTQNDPVEPFTDHGDGDPLRFAPRHEAGEGRLDRHLLQNFFDSGPTAPDDGHLPGHALEGAELAVQPLGFNPQPSRLRQSRQYEVGHIRGRDRSVKVTVNGEVPT